VKALTKNGIRVEKAVFYGSQASGKIRPRSDLDLAIISPDFGKDRFEEGKKLLQIAWRVDPRIEPVPISSESYENDTCRFGLSRFAKLLEGLTPKPPLGLISVGHNDEEVFNP
jgi:predicted nucleotidyltransferase